MIKLPWRRGKQRHNEINTTLNHEEKRVTQLARDLRRLELELGLIEGARRKGVTE